MDHFDKIVGVVLSCVFLDVSWQELGRPVFEDF
jgi:hypothetical protein